MQKRLTAIVLKLQITIVAVIIAGCQTHPDAVRISSQVSNFKETDPALKEYQATPVIDIHSHNFNAHDIPIRNIALGRRDCLPPWSWLATDSMAELLATAILAETQPENKADRDINASKSRALRASDTARNMALGGNLINSMTRRSQYSAIEKAEQHATTHTNEPLSLKESVVLRSIATFSTHRPVGFLTKSINELLDELSPFIIDLKLSDVDLAQQYWKENSSDIQFRIAHMMDMGPTYAQEPSKAEMRPFDEQISEMAALQKIPASRMAYFVAYNPFRDNQHPGEAMGMVERALVQSHAYGVKIYPPAGYRPFLNRIPHRPFCLFTPQPGLQWDYRYESNGIRISNAELDQRMLTLLCWCATNNIPVFVHSGYGEFQARSGYGQDMPNPRWWKELFRDGSRKHPELAELRLCFAHAGGGDSFFGDSKYKSWSRAVVDLCRRYPNVYCEVGCLDPILEAKQQMAFAVAMDELCHLPKDSEHHYDFGSKIMYGSDWYMPISSGVDRKIFLKKYQDVFLLPDLREYYRNFFFQNALHYLDAEHRIDNSEFSIADETKSQLRRLLAQALKD